MSRDHVPYRPGMILMPGQSTSISVEIPPEAAAIMQDGGHFVEVPPPAKVPVQGAAEALGLVPGLRAEKSRGGGWRCSNCHQMQPGGSWEVWVPDSVRHGDPESAITEACRRNAYNGHHSAWCLKCAPKVSRAERRRAAVPTTREPADQKMRAPLWHRVMNWLRS